MGGMVEGLGKWLEGSGRLGLNILGGGFGGLGCTGWRFRLDWVEDYWGRLGGGLM